MLKASHKAPEAVMAFNGAADRIEKQLRRYVKRLREQGHKVRVFVRRMPENRQDGLEYCFGNLGDPAAIDRAVKGAEIVIHCGAATKGGWPEHKGGTVVGTQNVVDASINWQWNNTTFSLWGRNLTDETHAAYQTATEWMWRTLKKDE